MMTLSSNPYTFMCCSPQPSSNRRPTIFFFHPVKLGVWKSLNST